MRAVVFGYHDVGDRCLRALLSAGFDVSLVVTHADDDAERPWFANVASTAADYGLPCVAPADIGAAGLLERVRRIDPQFIFSFYYRSLLGPELLAAARLAALNMHGSLLPKYRGRAPVNWAILNGETETGATLHHMVARADAGDIVEQQAVPILADDTAFEVMRKVTVAAEIALLRAAPTLLAGQVHGSAQSLSEGRYFGRRRAEDGRIDWARKAREIHNLVRAVAPPYPGAFGLVGEECWWVHRTRCIAREPRGGADSGARLIGIGGRCVVQCAVGTEDLLLLAAATTAGPVDLAASAEQLADKPIVLAA